MRYCSSIESMATKQDHLLFPDVKDVRHFLVASPITRSLSPSCNLTSWQEIDFNSTLCILSSVWDFMKQCITLSRVAHMLSKIKWTIGPLFWNCVRNYSKSRNTTQEFQQAFRNILFISRKHDTGSCITLTLGGCLGYFLNSSTKGQIVSHCSITQLMAGPRLSHRTSTCHWNLCSSISICCWSFWKSSLQAALYLNSEWMPIQSWSMSFPYLSKPLLNALWTMWRTQLPISTNLVKFLYSSVIIACNFLKIVLLTLEPSHTSVMSLFIGTPSLDIWSNISQATLSPSAWPKKSEV